MSKRLCILKEFKKNNSGATAIEFAIVAPIFFLLLIGIIELSMSFTARQLLAKAVDDVAREVRVGKLKNQANLQQIVKDKICVQLDILVASGCPGLQVDLNTYPNFNAVANVTTKLNSGNTNVDSSGFKADAGAARTVQHLRVFYPWPLYTDLIGKYWSSLAGNKMLLTASQTWRNEPFK